MSGVDVGGRVGSIEAARGGHARGMQRGSEHRRAPRHHKPLGSVAQSRNAPWLALLIAASSAFAADDAPSLYRIAPLTVRQVTLTNGMLQNQPAARLIALAIEPVQGGGAAKFAHRMPVRSGEGQSLNLPVRELSLIDVDLARRHPFEPPFKRVLLYWGCGETPGEKQPKSFRTDRDDDARLSARLAPSPIDTDRPRSLREIPVGKRLVAREDIRFPDDLRLRGTHELRRGEHASSFEIGERGEFLDPVEITRVWVSDEGAVRVDWKRTPKASAYFVNSFIQHKGSLDVVIWTSSRVSEAGWILSQSHPGGEQLARLRSSGVLLGPEADSCTVPAAVARHAASAMVIQVHAYADEVQAGTHAERDPAVGQIRIAPRATSSVLLQAPFRDVRASLARSQ